MPQGFGVAPRLRPGSLGLPQGLWGCPWGRGVAAWRRVTPNFGSSHPNMVWSHNLQHTALFGATTGGFCMVFQYATLIFCALEPMFGAPTPHLGPGRPGALFGGPKKGPEKHNFVEGSIPHEVPLFFLRGEWCVWYPGTLWVYQFPPKPSQGKVLKGFSANPKSPGAPLGPWVGCLLSLCGLLLPFVGPWPCLGFPLLSFATRSPDQGAWGKRVASDTKCLPLVQRASLWGKEPYRKRGLHRDTRRCRSYNWPSKDRTGQGVPRIVQRAPRGPWGGCAPLDLPAFRGASPPGPPES